MTESAETREASSPEGSTPPPFAAPAPAAPPSAPAPRRTLLLAFVAGVLFIAPIGLLLFVPAVRTWADERWQNLVWGCVAQDGVRLLLRDGAHPRELELVFRNEGDQPRALVCPGGEEGAAELDVLVEDASGHAVPMKEPDPRQDTVATEPRVLALPPRTQATLKIDISKYVDLPGPGRYRVTVERARLMPEEPRLRSNELAIDLK